MPRPSLKFIAKKAVKYTKSFHRALLEFCSKLCQWSKAFRQRSEKVQQCSREKLGDDQKNSRSVIGKAAWRALTYFHLITPMHLYFSLFYLILLHFILPSFAYFVLLYFIFFSLLLYFTLFCFLPITPMYLCFTLRLYFTFLFIYYSNTSSFAPLSELYYISHFIGTPTLVGTNFCSQLPWPADETFQHWFGQTGNHVFQCKVMLQ